MEELKDYLSFKLTYSLNNLENELFKDYDLSNDMQDQVINFMDEVKDKLREVSLRMVLKISDLRKMEPNNWQSLARTTCMKGAI